MWVIYNILFVIGFSLLLPRFFWRMARRGGYRRGFVQRFGLYDAETRRRLADGTWVWIHAVSVGEMFVAMRLMRELRARQPTLTFVVTTNTSTGHGIGRERLDARDVLLYFPLDLPAVMRRVLDAIRPRAILLTEAELWPNLIRLAHGRGVPVALMNGRISDSSFRGYRNLRFFVSRMLGMLTRMLMQSEDDRARAIALGAAPERVRVAGTVKYDMAIGPDGHLGQARNWLRAQGVADDAPVIVGGSTWAGEEMLLARAWRVLRETVPTLQLVLVPRHAERGGAVEQELRNAGAAVVRRSRQDAPVAGQGPAVLLADTTGELVDFYGCATVVFVGKSLGAHGGQNFIEPAALGKAVVVGPNLENFAEMAAEFAEARAFRQVRDEGDLVATLRDLLGNSTERDALGERARALVASKRGAVQRMAEDVERMLCGGTRE